MQFTKIYYSGAVKGIGKRFADKYGLKKFSHIKERMVVFGLYNDKDYNVLRGGADGNIVIFRGSDTLKLTKDKADIIKYKKARVYAISSFISDTLKDWEITHQILPLTATNPEEILIAPRGDSLFCYYKSEKSGEKYGYSLAKEVAEKTGLNIYLLAGKMYNRDEMIEIYKKCFLGLRLTTYDGLPNTVLELGLMGRRSIYNGDIPHSIPWENVDDICESIMVEYEYRHEPNKYIRKDIENFLNIGDQWMICN